MLALAQTALAQAARGCTTTPFTIGDAEQLLGSMPGAIYGKAHGAKSVVASVSGTPQNYRDDLFYFLVAYGTGGSDADGGLLGYFAVSKVIGTVYDISVPPGELVTGDGLARLQIEAAEEASAQPD